MNKYLSELSELHKVKQKNQTLEKIKEVNLAFNSLREDIQWFKENDWYLSREQAQQIKAIREFVFSNSTINEGVEE